MEESKGSDPPRLNSRSDEATVSEILWLIVSPALLLCRLLGCAHTAAVLFGCSITLTLPHLGAGFQLRGTSATNPLKLVDRGRRFRFKGLAQAYCGHRLHGSAQRWKASTCRLLRLAFEPWCRRWIDPVAALSPKLMIWVQVGVLQLFPCFPLRKGSNFATALGMMSIFRNRRLSCWHKVRYCLGTKTDKSSSLGGSTTAAQQFR